MRNELEQKKMYNQKPKKNTKKKAKKNKILRKRAPKQNACSFAAFFVAYFFGHTSFTLYSAFPAAAATAAAPGIAAHLVLLLVCWCWPCCAAAVMPDRSIAAPTVAHANRSHSRTLAAATAWPQTNA